MNIDSTTVLDWAHEEGFELAGICLSQPPPHYEEYLAWISEEMHGSMQYLERHAAVKQHPKHLMASVQSMLMVGLNYVQEPDRSPGTPRIARYAMGRDYHRVLRQKLKRIVTKILEIEPDTETRICVDSTPLIERDFAQLAGLGWFGKNTMLIDSKRGSWFVIGSLLLSKKLEPSEPSIGSCGTCRACVDACPTGAIQFNDDRWQIDARNCISYLTIEHRGEISKGLATRLGDWTFGCDVCQEVCPFNQPRSNQPLRAAKTREPDFLNKREWPKLTEIVQMSEAQWDSITQGSAVRRAGFHDLKRNAMINLSHRDRSNSESKRGSESS